MNNELYIKIHQNFIFDNQLLIEYVIHSGKSYELRSMKTKLILMQFISKRVGKPSYIMLNI